MVKKYFFTLALMAVIGCLSAQSLQFEWNGHAYAQGETIICDQAEDWGEMVLDMQVRNLSNAPLDVVIAKEEVHIVEGTENSFCWGKHCYSHEISVSPDPLTIDAGAVTNEGGLSFHHVLDLTYSGDPSNFAVGTSVVRYYAYSESDDTDKAYIEVWFAYNAESVSEKPAFSFGHAYPNPASSMVRFDYNLSAADNASVAIYNLLGQEVMRQQLNGLQGVAAFSVAGLNEGIYFCNLFVNGQSMKTEKFIVKK